MINKRVVAVTKEQQDRLAKAYGQLMDVLCEEVEGIVRNHPQCDYTDKDSVNFNKLLKADCGQTALIAVRVDQLVDGSYIHDAAAERFRAEKTVSNMEQSVRETVERFANRNH